MTDNTAAFVAFQYPLEDEQIVPVEEAFAWADAQAKMWFPRRIIWADGSWSFGKGWWARGTGRLARIGAGAYGDLTVAEREAGR